MNPTNELTGVLVLVHPGLPQDPANRQGQVGMITGADLENDDVFVSFGQSQQALYSTDALLVFKPTEALYNILENDTGTVSKENLKTLFQLNLLQQFGFAPGVRQAMTMVKGNHILRDLSMDTLSNQLKNQLKQRFNTSLFR
jgi:hypothetical protein